MKGKNLKSGGGAGEFPTQNSDFLCPPLQGLTRGLLLTTQHTFSAVYQIDLPCTPQPVPKSSLATAFYWDLPPYLQLPTGPFCTAAHHPTLPRLPASSHSVWSEFLWSPLLHLLPNLPDLVWVPQPVPAFQRSLSFNQDAPYLPPTHRTLSCLI